MKNEMQKRSISLELGEIYATVNHYTATTTAGKQTTIVSATKQDFQTGLEMSESPKVVNG